MSVVERLSEEHAELTKLLRNSNEISLLSAAESVFTKSILMASASFLEQEVTRVIIDFFREVSTGNDRAVSFVQKKALDRQYHTLFDWKSGNANRFFSLFGSKYATRMKNLQSNDEAFAKGIGAFISIGAERNLLVHRNFGAYSLEKTADELVALHSRAHGFVLQVERELQRPE